MPLRPRAASIPLTTSIRHGLRTHFTPDPRVLQNQQHQPLLFSVPPSHATTTYYTPIMVESAVIRDVVASTSDCIPTEPSFPSAAPSLTYSDDSEDQDELAQVAAEKPRQRRASTRLIAQNARDIQRITGETSAEFVQRCCGGGCCRLNSAADGADRESVAAPDNDAYRSLKIKIDQIPTFLTKVTELPEPIVSFEPIRAKAEATSPTDSGIALNDAPDAATPSLSDALAAMHVFDTQIQPPRFVQPHPPHHVHPVRIHNCRSLTREGAEKRTYHFDLDITDYPDEEGTDFKVGGAIGVMAPNCDSRVEEILDALMVPRFLRDKPVLMKTTKGRWPTVWGEEQARELVTTRRDIFTWCIDIQSYPPTKPLLRVLAEHASAENEKKILMYLCSSEGQGVFCDFRTGPGITLSQIMHAFPSSHPPLGDLLSVLQPLMPRFYSLSNDPHASFQRRDNKQHRLVEIAVTVHESDDWQLGQRTGVGSGYFERQAQKFIKAQEAGEKTPEFYVPMFKGLMANPLAKQFNADGPMLLIGAGVGIAPFRGFVQRRLKQANCANKVWVLQGIRDSLVDEIYSGEWGVHEDEVKRVVQSRRGEGRYVQEEVRNQSDLVWYIINSLDGRVFVCGSSRGMGEGVEEALVDVAMAKGNLEREEARNFWNLKKEAGQYIAETW